MNLISKSAVVYLPFRLKSLLAVFFIRFKNISNNSTTVDHISIYAKQCMIKKYVFHKSVVSD